MRWLNIILLVLLCSCHSSRHAQSETLSLSDLRESRSWQMSESLFALPLGSPVTASLGFAERPDSSRPLSLVAVRRVSATGTSSVKQSEQICIDAQEETNRAPEISESTFIPAIILSVIFCLAFLVIVIVSKIYYLKN